MSWCKKDDVIVSAAGVCILLITSTSGLSQPCTDDHRFLFEEQMENLLLAGDDWGQTNAVLSITTSIRRVRGIGIFPHSSPSLDFLGKHRCNSACFLEKDRNDSQLYSFRSATSSWTDVFAAFFQWWQMMHPLSHYWNPTSQPKASSVSIQAAL